MNLQTRPARLAALAPAALLLAASSALAAPSGTLFSDDFQTGLPKPGWSSNTIVSFGEPTTWFAGDFSDSTAIALRLPAAPPPESSTGSGGGGTGGGGGGSAPDRVRYTLVFDLLAIDSWDGLDPRFGPDAFRVSVNDITRFNEFLANVNDTQTFRNRQPDLGLWHFYGNPNYGDAIYRRVAVPFELPIGIPLEIRFHTTPLQGLGDESWGIDNVNVGYTYVPAPGALAALGLTGLLAARRRR
jgi:hypothetical protein